MKIKFTLLLLVAACISQTNAQVIITQNFNNPSALSSTGWIKTNNSSPAGSTSWFTGSPGVFPALSSPDTTYLAANYNNTTGGTGNISNWLITPTVIVNNGGVLQFATRTNTVGSGGAVSPDRLQVYLSTGVGSNVGTTATSVGTFTTTLVTVNPNLTTTGYPTVWTVYTATLSGITGTLTGRFGFRYFVPSAGPTGTNSSYIGIDNIKYELPCPNPTLVVTSSTTGICSGNTFSIDVTGANTYTYSSGQNTSSVTLTPTATTIYTVTGSSTPNCNSSATIAITVTQTPILSIPDVTVCAGVAATLAVTGASSYSWSTGSTSPTIVETPTANATYTITGFNGDCSASKVVSVTIGTELSVNASSQQTLICSGKSATISSNGASSYSYTSGTFTSSANTASAVVSPTANTVYTISASSGSCTGSTTLIITVNPSPVIAISPASQTVCTNSSLTFTASGAASYSWTNTSSISSILSIVSPSTTGTFTYGVSGTATNGCTGGAVVSRVIDICAGIESINNKEKLYVYPNPFSNEIKISGFSGNVEIYNALGQMVIAETINDQRPINTSELIKGIYIMKAYSEDHKIIGTVKVIKN